MPAALRRRRRAASSGPWAQKKTPTAVDAFALNENENVRAFPALIMPVPVDIRGFSSTSPASPGLSRFLNYPVPLQERRRHSVYKIFRLRFVVVVLAFLLALSVGTFCYFDATRAGRVEITIISDPVPTQYSTNINVEPRYGGINKS